MKKIIKEIIEVIVVIVATLLVMYAINWLVTTLAPDVQKNREQANKHMVEQYSVWANKNVK